MSLYKISLVGLLFSLISCANQSNLKKSKFHFSKTENDVFGNIHIIVDGKDFTENCKVEFASENYRETVKIGSGNIQLMARDEEIYVESIYCKNGLIGIPVSHKFAPGEFSFGKLLQDKMIYFGNIQINWKTEGPSPILYLLSLPLAYLIGGSTVELKIKVEDKLHSFISRHPSSFSKKFIPKISKIFPIVHKDYLVINESMLALAKEKK